MRFSSWLLRLLLGSRLPKVSGFIETDGISSKVKIRRDKYGVPYIQAENDLDAWYGLGFCQAQDRTFQLEIMMRAVRGTLSEVLGQRAVGIDRLSRQIGFVDNAASQINVLDSSIKDIIQAFSLGITEGSKLGIDRMPHEFVLLRKAPSVCTSIDVLAIAKLHAFILSSNWDTELARYRIMQADGSKSVIDLDPSHSFPNLGKIANDLTDIINIDPLLDDLSSFHELVGSSGGSNNWVISGHKTASGRPLLSNDPHLKPTLPSQWYFANIRTPEWSVAGASFIGGPAFPAGHNGRSAWGVTAGLVDTTDLFLEILDIEDGTFRQGDDFIPYEKREEIIHVKGAQDVLENVIITPRGPVIGSFNKRKDGTVSALSMRAIWLDILPVDGLINIHKAGSFQDFRNACQDWPLSSLSMVYADKDNSIGWQLVGTVPRRKNMWGTIPQPGWFKDIGWEEKHVSDDDLPHKLNPSVNFIATANDNLYKHCEDLYLGIDWLDDYRVSRIGEKLIEKDDWELDDVANLQLDLKSMPWFEIRDVVLSTPIINPEIDQALEILQDWDGILSANSVSATVFEYFLIELIEMIALAKAPNSFEWALGKGVSPIKPYTLLVARRVGHLVKLLNEQPDGWFDSGWQRIIQIALTNTIKSLRKSYGSIPANWLWGNVRDLKLKHVLGEITLLSSIFNRGPLRIGGDANTVFQAAPALDDLSKGPLAIPSMRMVIDVGEWENSIFSLPGGQSGNPLSSHYDDLLPLWLNGKGIGIAWKEETIRSSTVHKLTLSPIMRQ